MTKQKRRYRRREHWQYIAVEAIMASLGIVSVALLGVIVFGQPSVSELESIEVVDSVIATMFLLEFALRLYRSKDRKSYFKHNWYMLFAAIPVPGGAAQFLRVIRVDGLVRLLRVSDHLAFESHQKNLG